MLLLVLLHVGLVVLYTLTWRIIANNVVYANSAIYAYLKLWVIYGIVATNI